VRVEVDHGERPLESRALARDGPQDRRGDAMIAADGDRNDAVLVNASIELLRVVRGQIGIEYSRQRNVSQVADAPVLERIQVEGPVHSMVHARPIPHRARPMILHAFDRVSAAVGKPDQPNVSIRNLRPVWAAQKRRYAVPVPIHTGQAARFFWRWAGRIAYGSPLVDGLEVLHLYVKIAKCDLIGVTILPADFSFRCARSA